MGAHEATCLTEICESAMPIVHRALFSIYLPTYLLTYLLTHLYTYIPTYNMEPLECLSSELSDPTVSIYIVHDRKEGTYLPNLLTSDAVPIAPSFQIRYLRCRSPVGPLTVRSPALVSLNWHNRSAPLILLGPDRDLNFSINHVLFPLVLVSLDGYI